MWTMTVPVLSTVHLPGPYAYQDLLETSVGCEDILFVRLSDWNENEYPDWAEPICKWAGGLPEYDGWIRFSAIGDEIETLPRYDGMWS